ADHDLVACDDALLDRATQCAAEGALAALAAVVDGGVQQVHAAGQARERGGFVALVVSRVTLAEVGAQADGREREARQRAPGAGGASGCVAGGVGGGGGGGRGRAAHTAPPEERWAVNVGPRPVESMPPCGCGSGRLYRCAMDFVAGFLLWLAVGLLGGFVARATYRAAGPTAALTLLFGVFGAFVGGMLGMSAYIFHNPVPLRPGGILGAVLGGFFFPYLYNFVARKAV